MYAVKEIYRTLQGEGRHSGRAAVFLRFAGCDLWTGRQEDRTKGPGVCSEWCDTDFVGTDGPGGGKYKCMGLADAVEEAWGPDDRKKRFVVCTGGEPLLQLDWALVNVLRARDFYVAVETNGRHFVPDDGVWVTFSPKLRGGPWKLKRCDEVKLVYPAGQDPDDWASFPASHYYVQPLWVWDMTLRAENTRRCVEYCLRNPKWKLSLQAHKYLDIP